MMLVVSSLLPFLLLAQFAAANLEIFSQFEAELDEARDSCSNENPCEAERKEPWSYKGCNGPDYWHTNYPMCGGQNQSPIALNSDDAELNENLSELSLNNYDVPLTSATIINNGHTVQVIPSDDVARTMSINGDPYNLSQFHWHWGNGGNASGSEHTMNGKNYTAELHFVHQNSNNDIAVLGVFLQARSENKPEKQRGHHGEGNKKRRRPNAAMESIVKELPKVLYKDMRTDLTSSINLYDLLPFHPPPANSTSFYRRKGNSGSYFRYYGSLTTPGCNEGIVWTVMEKCVSVTKEQMDELPKLYAVKEEDAGEDTESCHIVNNFRRVQPLNNRVVYKNK